MAPKRPADSLLWIVLAALPALPAATTSERAFFAGALIFAALGLTLIVFEGGRALFLRGFAGPAFMLWLGVLAQAGVYAAGAEPLWILAVWLLLPPHYPGAALPGRGFKKLLGRAAAVWLVLMYVGTAHETLESGWEIAFAATPAGIFLLLVPAALLWQYPPRAGEG
jgi:hypothetical protein